MNIYEIVDYWKEDKTYFAIYYQGDTLYFSEAEIEEPKLLEYKKKIPFVIRFIIELFKRNKNGW